MQIPADIQHSNSFFMAFFFFFKDHLQLGLYFIPWKPWKLRISIFIKNIRFSFIFLGVFLQVSDTVRDLMIVAIQWNTSNQSELDIKWKNSLRDSYYDHILDKDTWIQVLVKVIFLSFKSIKQLCMKLNERITFFLNVQRKFYLNNKKANWIHR